PAPRDSVAQFPLADIDGNGRQQSAPAFPNGGLQSDVTPRSESTRNTRNSVQAAPSKEFDAPLSVRTRAAFLRSSQHGSSACGCKCLCQGTPPLRFGLPGPPPLPVGIPPA